MSLDPGILFVSFMTSLVGFALFTYGRKQERPPQLIGGLVLMCYPYFVGSISGLLIVGALIAAAVWMAVRMGW